MSKSPSTASLDAMKDADRHAGGDTKPHNDPHPAAAPVHDHTKPAGDLFEVALRKAQVAPSDAVAVGDTPYDVKAAAKCGIQTIALRSGGFTDAELRENSPLTMFNDVGALYEAQHEEKS